jgi:hypothetical protein
MVVTRAKKKCRRHRLTEWAIGVFRWATFEVVRIKARFCKDCGHAESEVVH